MFNFNLIKMRKYIVLIILFVPVAFLVLKLSAVDIQVDDEQQLPCGQYGTIVMNFNGNRGCPYAFDFNSLVNSNCMIVDIDLDRSISGIQHYKETQMCVTWTNGYDGVIHMLPKSGYGGQGFTVSNDVIVHFANNTTEELTWTMYVNDYGGPYPASCY